MEQDKLGERDVANLVELAKIGGLYRVRIANSFVMASVPACHVLSSRFADQLTVHMTSSKPIAITLQTISSECVDRAQEGVAEWRTLAHVKHGDEAPRPNLDPSNTGKATAAPSVPTPQTAPVEEPGFFQKYVRHTPQITTTLYLPVADI